MNRSLEIIEQLMDPEIKSNRNKRMELMVQYLKRYIDTYEDQYGYQNYSDSTLIDDILYGLGVALNPEEHQFASGFDTFKSKLIEHLNS
jgi:hypothetical protein